MEEKYYIRDSRGYVGNCLLWWKANKNGYTCDLDEAGQFSKREAEKICGNRSTDVMYPVQEIDGIAERHVDHQRMPIITKNGGSNGQEMSMGS